MRNALQSIAGKYVRVFGYDLTGTHAYIVYELVEGISATVN